MYILGDIRKISSNQMLVSIVTGEGKCQWEWEEDKHNGSKEGNKPNNSLALTFHISI